MRVEFPASKEGVNFSKMVAQHRGNILTGLLWIGIVALFLTYTMVKKNKEQDSYLLSEAYLRALSTNSKANVDYQDIMKSVKKHPELMPAFAPYLEQYFISEGNLEEAKKILFQALNRFDPALSYQKEYATVSLLMEEKQFEESLERSIQLKTSLESGGALQKNLRLTLFNMLRIMLLEKELGLNERAMASSLALKTLLADKEKMPPSVASEFMSHFTNLRASHASFFD